MHLRTSRFTLRDFREDDRAELVAYQLDPRYRGLYDLDEDQGRAKSDELFDLFLRWQAETPRNNFQVGVFDASGRLCGCAGLRVRADDTRTAVLGIELAPACWGRYRLALDVIAAMIEHGFTVLGLDVIVNDTSTGNKRVEKLARWFGFWETARRDGPDWMRARGWQEIDWTMTRDAWATSDRRTRGLPTPSSASDETSQKS